MKQFKTVLKFELKGYFKNKIFLGTTMLFMVLIIGAMFLPQIAGYFKNNDSESGEKEVILVTSEDGELSQVLLSTLRQSLSGYEIISTDESGEEIGEKVQSGEVWGGIVFTSPTDYKYYVDNLSMYDSNTEVIDEALKNMRQIDAMIESGISQEEVEEILSVKSNHEVINMGKDQMQNFFYTYIMIFALYMVIMLYGQMVASNVATEKSSRAMELLVTSVSPTSMMFGKVIASCLAGFVQLFSIFGTAFICFSINKASWEGNMIITSMFGIPADLLVYMMIFFILGFFIYAFLYGAIGSTATRLEDINTTSTPLTLLFVGAFLVVMLSMSSGNVDNIAMKICSFVPFTSPMAMFTRIAMSTVPFYQILLSIVVLIASTVGVGFLSARIYRAGVLMYGNPPKLGTIIKAVFKS